MNKSGYRATAKRHHKFTALLIPEWFILPLKCILEMSSICCIWMCWKLVLPCQRFAMPARIHLPGIQNSSVFLCVTVGKQHVLSENKAPPIICSVLNGRVQKYYHFVICKAIYCSFLQRQAASNSWCLPQKKGQHMKSVLRVLVLDPGTTAHSQSPIQGVLSSHMMLSGGLGWSIQGSTFKPFNMWGYITTTDPINFVPYFLPFSDLKKKVISTRGFFFFLWSNLWVCQIFFFNSPNILWK